MTSCTVVIFYEWHQDPVPVRTVGRLLKYLKKRGFNTLCLEHASDMTFEEVIDSYEDYLEYWSDLAKVTSVKSFKVKEFLSSPWRKDIIIPAHASDKDTIESIRSGATIYRDDYALRLSLFSNFSRHGIKYCGMDIPVKTGKPEFYTSAAIAKRDNFIKNHIEHVCKSDGVAAYVGLGHYNVSKLLRADGHTVHDYYVAGLPPVTGHLIADDLIRADTEEGKAYRERHSFNMRVIDTYADPELDPVNVIKDHLSKVIGVNDTLVTNGEL